MLSFFKQRTPSFLILLLVFNLTFLSVSAKKKKATPNRGAKEQVVTGKVSQVKDDGNFTVIYQIGKTSVSKTCADEVKPFEGKVVSAKCRVHQGRILQIHSISEAKNTKKKK